MSNPDVFGQGSSTAVTIVMKWLREDMQRLEQKAVKNLCGDCDLGDVKVWVYVLKSDEGVVVLVLLTIVDGWQKTSV